MTSKESSGKPEIGWTKEYLLPLLRAMSVRGVFDVKYHGGSAERGKDITFSYQNPLGLSVHCAIQVKYPKVTAKQSEMEQLRGEIRAAFEQPYERSPNEPLHIHELYLVAPDGFTDEATRQIQNIPELAQRAIFYVDQPRLDQWRELASVAAIRDREDLSAVGNLAIVEIQQAFEISKLIEANPSLVRMYRLDFLDRLIAMPLNNPQISALAREAWYRFRTVNEMALVIKVVTPIGIGVELARQLRQQENREGREALSKLAGALAKELQAYV